MTDNGRTGMAKRLPGGYSVSLHPGMAPVRSAARSGGSKEMLALWRPDGTLLALGSPPPKSMSVREVGRRVIRRIREDLGQDQEQSSRRA